jgi:hypothetical protein
MSAYKIEDIDGGLALVDTANTHIVEWLDEIEIVGFPSENALTVRVSLCSSNDSNLQASDIEDADDIRLVMNDWLEDNGYSESIHCDFSSEESEASALAEAIALRDRFLGGDYTPFEARYRVWWTSEDKQGSMDCGDFVTIEEARASLPEMAAELLRIDGGSSPAGILAGTFSIEADRGHLGSGVEERFDVADFAPLAAAA